MATKISECKIAMAYALGRVACTQEGETTRVKLGDINPDWDHYELAGRGYGTSNDTCHVYYKGELSDPFGKEKYFFSILTIPEGWDLKHAIALCIAAIDMHKSEMAKKLKKEE